MLDPEGGFRFSGLVLALMSGVGFTSAAADTIHVPGDYATIQAAIDASQDGDVILVADGTYTGAGNKNLDFGGRAITVRCANAPSACIIDCEEVGRGFIFQSGETLDAVVDGFTITNGRPSTGIRGGGISLLSSSATITHCTFSNNQAPIGSGGAISVISDRNNLSVTHCVFRNNTASTFGGAIGFQGFKLTLADCVFENNISGTSGGAIRSSHRTATIENCIFRNNRAAAIGGALLLSGGSHSGEEPTTIVNCVFNSNSSPGLGGAIYFDSAFWTPRLVNCTFTNNVGAPTIFGGFTRLTATNCIVWDAEGGLDASCPIDVTFSTVLGGFEGEGNLDADPRFVDADGEDGIPGTQDDDLRISDGSPCINAGFNFAPDLPAGDLAGNARVANCRVDMGAYESPLTGPFVDCNNNGQIDDCDLDEGISEDCNGNAIPDECEPPDDCNGNGELDFCDLVTRSSQDCNANEIPDECDVAQGNDVDGNGIPDDCAYFRLVPVDPPPGLEPYPPVVLIEGNDIFLPPGERRVWLEIKLGGWGSSLFRTWQVTIDSSGYTNNHGAQLQPAIEFCTQDTQCEATLGGRSGCRFGLCEAGYQDTDRSEFVFPLGVSAVDVRGPDFRFGSNLLVKSFLPDDGSEHYGGTLVLDIPTDAGGTYTLGFLFKPGFCGPPDEATFMFDVDEDTIGTGAARITICSEQIAPCCTPTGDCEVLGRECCAALGGVTLVADESCEGDSDADGLDGACGDQCPNDPNKTDPGMCGCGVPEDPIDLDGDGVAEFCGAIPTVSEWGLVILALLLLIAGKIYFGFRARPAQW